MDQVKGKIENALKEKSFCSIATSSNRDVDNAVVAFYSENLNLYFGTYNDTLKSRYVKTNSQVAICIENIQIHGMAHLIEDDSEEYKKYFEKYLLKFPDYKFFYEIEHEFYRVDPLVIWFYNGYMSRDKIIIDENYYQRIKPYETHLHFNKKR